MYKKEYSATYRTKHLEQTKAACIKSATKWVREHRLQNAIIQARHRAKKLDLPFDLSVEDLVVPEVCPILGMKLLWSDGPRKENSPSLDRSIPELGYVKENVHIISWRANRIKNNATPEELIAIAEYMKGVE